MQRIFEVGYRCKSRTLITSLAMTRICSLSFRLVAPEEKRKGIPSNP
jgi:hypothetical protein